MNDKFENLVSQYKKALLRLQDVMTKKKDEYIRDSAIQRFEFTYELAWKGMKAYLKEKGVIEINFPKDVIRTAFKAGLISDDPLWLDMVDTRNQTSHLYKESMAEDVYSKIKKYLPLFEKLNETLL
ncbi:hypothetical protein A2230_01860 [candidate division WOR-1 bacterium RIFOXYA2_FULL_36_21]|uniref:Nucleotidyltransferase n=1 Tax=candidate division WOR-1 bacterium RIFOXYB2_FULL_36_35 TaxID=1802578 RepID=A0A1F4S9D7_UNCSA|nr:MAG: hypothetical protein A2230_01860 [candidate division WOR-1 bacterium RIFOXYA2_FULL_36_21]OGC16106.1 MAG: hypothetical protein A2282_05540 [candidate division WOR-1 bacterium RIFOXYA12_FULL_36_13]OGC16353.1 MAG: hypothetical protein A2290_04585 [candidate division WOR-1 bacterium RIFOXYB2_FULL_36_35]